MCSGSGGLCLGLTQEGGGEREKDSSGYDLISVEVHKSYFVECILKLSPCFMVQRHTHTEAACPRAVALHSQGRMRMLANRKNDTLGLRDGPQRSG